MGDCVLLLLVNLKHSRKTGMIEIEFCACERRWCGGVCDSRSAGLESMIAILAE
jgi:hypothetical protein